MKKLTFYVLSLSLLHVLSAQERLLEPKQLKKDYAFLVDLIDAHPKPHRHITEKALKRLIDSTRQLMNNPMSALDFYRLTSPIYAALKDGHTSVSMPSGWLKKHRKTFGVFPYKIFINEEDQMYLIDNYSNDETIPMGSEVIKINGLSSAEFIHSVSKYISYEQEIFRNTIIESLIDFYLLLHFGQVTSLDIEYLSDKHRTHHIQYIPHENWRDELEETETLKEKRVAKGEPYAYEKIAHDAGLLRIYSFAISDQSKYDVFLRDMFRKIKNDSIQSLIIDVRGNTGGYPRVVSKLLHWISDGYFKTMAKSETKVSKAYKRYFQQMAPSLNFYQAQFVRMPHTVDIKSLFSYENGTIFTEDAFNEAPQEMYNEFTGDLYLLTDRRSYSASSSFAATFRCYQMGLIIGSETGGTKIFHANSMYETLKHSGLTCIMATVRDYTTCFLEEDEGIKPDLVAEPTVLDRVAKRDAALEYALMVIEKVKEMRAGELDK